jgi:hypothetical protein
MSLGETNYMFHFQYSSYTADSRLTDGGKRVSLKRRSQENFWYSFLSETELTPRSYAAGMIKLIEKFNDLIGNRTRDLPAFSIVPRLTALPRAPHSYGI